MIFSLKMLNRMVGGSVGTLLLVIIFLALIAAVVIETIIIINTKRSGATIWFKSPFKEDAK